MHWCFVWILPLRHCLLTSLFQYAVDNRAERRSNWVKLSPYTEHNSHHTFTLKVAFMQDIQKDASSKQELRLPVLLWTQILSLFGAEFSWHIDSLYWSTATLRSCSADRLTEKREKATGLPPSEINPTKLPLGYAYVHRYAHKNTHTCTLPAAVAHVHFHAAQLKMWRWWHTHTC